MQSHIIPNRHSNNLLLQKWLMIRHIAAQQIYIFIFAPSKPSAQECKSPLASNTPLCNYLEPNFLRWKADLLRPSIVERRMGLLTTVGDRDHPLLHDPRFQSLDRLS